MQKKQGQNLSENNIQINYRAISIKILKFLIWFAGLYASCYVSFEKIYFIISGFYLIFSNLGKRKEGDTSAYSVFNKGFKKLPGTFSTDEMLFKKIQHKQSDTKQKLIMDEQQQLKAQKINQYFQNPSKYGNKSCFCRSQIKFKKCCFIKKKKEQQEQKNRKKNRQRQNDIY